MKSVFIDVTIVVVLVCNFDVLLGAPSRVLVVVNIIWCCLTNESGYVLFLGEARCLSFSKT